MSASATPKEPPAAGDSKLLLQESSALRCYFVLQTALNLIILVLLVAVYFLLLVHAGAPAAPAPTPPAAVMSELFKRHAGDGL